MMNKHLLTWAAVFALASAHAPMAFSQTAVPAAPTPAATPATSISMKKLGDHYVEGPGYVTFFHQQTKGYGGTYAECEKNCLADARCKMIEFYKPLRKCHLYNHVKWSGKSRDADVALKEGGN
jgi:hypothetical protein